VRRSVAEQKQSTIFKKQLVVFVLKEKQPIVPKK